MPTLRLVFLSRLCETCRSVAMFLRCVVLTHPALVFSEGHVQAPVQGVLDAPSAHHLRQSLRRGIQAADVVPGLYRGLSRRLPAAHHLDHRAQAGPVLAGAQVPLRPPVRGCQARHGDADCPALPTFYPSVVLVQGGGVVVGNTLEAELLRSLEQVPHVFVQLTLVFNAREKYVVGAPVQNPLGDVLVRG